MSSQVNIDNIIKIITNNKTIDNTEQTNFINILKDAQAVVSEGFESVNPENISNKKFYEFAFNLVNNEFDTLIKSIENMRSSYLPADVLTGTFSKIKNPDTVESVIEEISNESTPLESYQNAFFRMVGLPSWEDVIEDTEGSKLSIIDTDGIIKDDVVTSDNIYTAYLDRRQAFSTIGCAAGVAHFDLVSANVSTDSFLKKNFKFSDEAVAKVVLFSDIISQALIADQNDTTTIQALESSYKAFLSEITVEKSSDGKPLLIKVQEIYEKNSDAINPIDWLSLSLEQFCEETSIKTVNYTAFLLYIYYAFVNKNPSNFLQTPDIEKVYRDLVLKEPSDNSLHNIEKNIYTYSSLLFPMVKDGRISKCINEPDKIVADPFLPITKRMVNGKFIRSSLLESIIRIRTDVISGTTSYKTEGIPYTIGEDDDNEVNQDTVSGELLGYLESLLIIRMLDSLEALAKGTRKNIEKISVTQRRTGKGLFGSCYDPKGSVLSAVPVVDREFSKQRIVLNNYALIEDSIMLLLGTKDIDQDSLSLQTGVNRNSSVPNSHLMSSLISLVQVPRKYINETIEKEDRDLKTQNSVGSKSAKDVEVTIGIRSGVGVVDLIAIIIALLTIDEVSLVSLMTKSQVDMMLSQINQDTFDEDKRRQIFETPMSTAVNTLTQRVHSVYKLFVDLLIN